MTETGRRATIGREEFISRHFGVQDGRCQLLAYEPSLAMSVITYANEDIVDVICWRRCGRDGISATSVDHCSNIQDAMATYMSKVAEHAKP